MLEGSLIYRYGVGDVRPRAGRFAAAPRDRPARPGELHEPRSGCSRSRSPGATKRSTRSSEGTPFDQDVMSPSSTRVSDRKIPSTPLTGCRDGQIRSTLGVRSRLACRQSCADRPTTVVARGYDALGADYLEWVSAFVDPGRDRMLKEFIGRLASGATCPRPRLWAGPARDAIARGTLRGDWSGHLRGTARGCTPQRSRGFVRSRRLHARSISALGRFDGVTAFYSIIHVPRDEHPPSVRAGLSVARPRRTLSGDSGSGRRPRLVRRMAGSADVLQQSRRGRQPSITCGRELRSTHRRCDGDA